MHQNIITINDLSKKYKSAKEYSLSNVSLEIKAGEKFGLFGPNGAGKTTLISLICGIFHSNEGKICYFKNDNPIDLKKMKNIIGFVPQDIAIYLELTCFQNIQYFGTLYNLSKSELKTKSEYLFNILGLTNVATKKVKHFSGGMKRRLNLAIGVVHSPEILFLDEPTVGIDIQSKNAIIDFLNQINKSGTTIIYTSHHLEEAEQLCDRIAILDYGKIITIGKLQNLIKDHNVDNLNELYLKLTGTEYRDNV